VSDANRSTDLVTVAVGLVALAVSGFFLLADDPSLEDVGTVLLPVALVVAGLVTLVGATARTRRAP
jgi:hypothetical protein